VLLRNSIRNCIPTTLSPELLTFGSLLIAGLLKFAIVATLRLEATAARGALLKDLDREPSGWKDLDGAMGRIEQDRMTAVKLGP
jgi:hypothetical protein